MVNHVSFSDIHQYLANGQYPVGVMTKGERANFRKACRKFELHDGRLFNARHNKEGMTTRLPVIQSADEIKTLIQEVHQGRGDSSESKALCSHHGIMATVSILSNRFYWRSIQSDVKACIETCDPCQKTNPSLLKAKPELRPVPAVNRCMSQVGIDIAFFKECGGYTCMVLAVDYFSKWSEGKALKDNNALVVARFLYELICRDGCFDIQINDQGREFVNQVSAELHGLTGIEQRITSAYHPQANALVERQNRTIKEKLLKVLEGSNEGWVAALDGVLFAHRTARHRSTGFSPFYLMYGREPKLPIDVVPEEQFPLESEEDEFSSEYFEMVASAMTELRQVAETRAKSAIMKAQARQKLDYDRRHGVKCRFSIGDKVLLRNLKRADRKGGKATFPWKGPYVIEKLYPNNTCTLLNASMTSLSQRHNLCNLKTYKQNDSSYGSLTTNSSAKPCTTVMGAWLPQLSLNMYDRYTIVDGKWLTDSVIDAAQALLSAQQLDVGGFQSCVLSQTGAGFAPAVQPSVQIHFDSTRSHWVTSSSCRNRVELADSMYTGSVTTDLKRQLFHCYAQLVKGNRLQVHIVDVHQQTNGSDCGVFAIANTVEFVSADGNPTLSYDTERMRQHLVTCLECGVMIAFPKNGKQYEKQKRTSSKAVWLSD